MCEINPKHTKIFRLEVFTSHPSMTREDFEQIVAEKALAMEMLGNMDGMVRVHIHEDHSAEDKIAGQILSGEEPEE